MGRYTFPELKATKRHLVWYSDVWSCHFSSGNGVAMRFYFACLLGIVCLAGCARAPIVTKGKFDTTYTLIMQRGSADVVVQTSGPASFQITNYQMNHPMGSRPDTEATFKTPAGTFNISDRNNTSGLTINGKQFDYPTDLNGRYLITIDAQGTIKADEPKAVGQKK